MDDRPGRRGVRRLRQADRWQGVDRVLTSWVPVDLPVRRRLCQHDQRSRSMPLTRHCGDRWPHRALGRPTHERTEPNSRPAKTDSILPTSPPQHDRLTERLRNVAPPNRQGGRSMSDSVYRVTDVIGTSTESWEAAARNAVATAA